MQSWRKRTVMGLWAAAMAAWVCLAATQDAAQAASPAPPWAGAADKPAVVLDRQSVWHIYEVLKAPVVQLDTGLKAITSPFQWLDRDTPAAPEGWNKAAFSDSSWLCGDATLESQTPYLANLYLRARFEVTDPAQVKDLKLSLTYHGGAIVFVNGKEVARGNLGKEDKDPTAIAEAYPKDAFVTADDQLISRYDRKADTVRERKLTEVAIPWDELHKGVNVVAIEVVRSPYDKSVDDYWKRNAGKDRREGFAKDASVPYDLAWYTCGLTDVTLMAGSSSGLVPNATRPKGLQAWNSGLLDTDAAQDFGDRCAPLGPVTIEGPRNGWSSGKVVIGSSKAIAGLKVTCGELKQGAAVIPASAMRARYAVAFADQPRTDTPLESLLEAPLDSFPVVGGNGGGAVVPIWLTVKIPADAKPGEYTGQATVEVTGEKVIEAPIQLKVADDAVPDTQDYRTWIELMESPDTLAVEYKVPLWSEKHWELIAQSMRYMGEIGSRTVYVPLIAQTNSGNSESMVRWIKKADGTYGYDFSIMDKYLDYAEKYMGKPKFVVFNTWEIYLSTPKNEVALTEDDKQHLADFRSMEKSWLAARWDLRGKGPAITTVDPATGATALAYLPRFEDPACKADWKPLFDALHQRMAQRGLENTMLLGMASDYAPDKEEVATIEDVSGNLPWARHTHGGSRVGVMLSGGKKDGLGKVAYTAYVWNTEYAEDPSKGRLYGWKRPEIYTEFRRFGALNDWPLSTLLLMNEIEITGAQRGLGRVGADFWPVLRDRRGERRGWVWNEYPQSLWHSCNLMSHLLDPGPTGPVATTRYEMMREGIQECEARIDIEKVLTDPALKAKLGDDLANRAQKLLDDRIWQELKAFGDMQLSGRQYTTSARSIWSYNGGGQAGHCWYAGSGWQDEAQELYQMAGEVDRKAAK